MLRQFAAPPFEIGRGDVVEQQRAILQVATGQLGFDERLLAAQPVERGIDFLGGDLAEPCLIAGARSAAWPCGAVPASFSGPVMPWLVVATNTGRCAASAVLSSPADALALRPSMNRASYSPSLANLSFSGAAMLLRIRGGPLQTWPRPILWQP